MVERTNAPKLPDFHTASHMYTFNKQNNVIKNSKDDYYKSILGCFISGVHFVWHGHGLRPTVNGSYLKASGGLGSSGQEPDVTESVNADIVCTGEQCSFLLPNIYSLRLLCRPTETGPPPPLCCSSGVIAAHVCLSGVFPIPSLPRHCQ